MRKIRLSILIPVLLILSALASSTLLFLEEMRIANRTIEQTAHDDINTTMTHLQNILDTQLATDNLEDAKLSLSVSALHPSIQTMLLANENDTVLLAGRYLWEGTRAAQVSAYDEPTARQVRRTRASFTSINRDRSLLRGYYPITLNIAAGGRLSSRIGLLFVEYDLSPRLAQSRHNAVIQAASFSGLMIAVAVSVAMLLHYLISKRVAKITAVSQRFSAGDHDARVQLRGGDELAELGQAFDQMAEKIATNQKALTDSQRTLSLHLRQTILGVIEWDRNFRAREWNPAAELIFGYRREEAVGHHAAELILPPRIAGDIDKVWKNLLSQVGGRYNVNENVTKDGRTILCEWFNTPLVDEKGAIMGVMSLGRDITERKLTEDALRQSEENLNLAQAVAQTGSWYLDVLHNELKWSAETYRMFGIPQGQPLTLEIFAACIFPEDRERVLQAWNAALRGAPYDIEHRILVGNETRWVRERAEVSFDAAGNALNGIGTVQDITERKLAEQNIALLNFALNNVHEAAFLIDENARFQYVNEEACRALGYSRDELLGLGTPDVDPDFPSERWPEHWAELRTQHSLTFEGCHKTREGRIFPVEINANYFEYGGQGYNLAMVRDISERKQAEQERLANLRFLESMDQINRAIQGARDLDSIMSDVLDAVLAIFDCDRVFLQYPCNPEASMWQVPMERSKPEYPGVHTLKLMMPMSPEVAETFRILLDADGPVKFGPGTGHAIPAEVSERFGIKSFMSMALHPMTGEPWQFGMHQCSYPRVWTPEDERLLQEIGRRLADGLTSLLAYRGLQKSEEFNRNILETVDEGFIVVDRDYRILSANKAFCSMGQSSEDLVVGRMCYEVSHHIGRPCFESGEECAVRRTFETGAAHSAFHTHEDASGTKQYVELKSFPIFDASGTVVSAIETINDVTEKRKLEGQLRQAQKMEAVGTLAGGVAHDFNNMLMVIIGHTEMALQQMDPDQPFFASLQEIQKAAGRSADLTRQLLAFARKQTMIPKVLDLNETVEGMLKMLRRLIGEDIDLAWLPGTKVWPIKVDPSQIDQLLANLCVNARDAIAGVGKLTIETRNAIIDEAYCADHPEAVPGEYILLAVSDDGCGMDTQTLGKIFEPFFTTKEMGKGTGLGLATVYGIVKQNNGFINVYSESGQGSTFKIYLPRHAGKNAEMPKESPAAQVAGGHETILLAEDEVAILDMARQILEGFGYRVLTASSPGEAIRVAKEYTGNIHLLITDVIMPEMNGLELANNLLSLYPKLRRLYMSGYSDSVIARHGILDEGINFIQKPFSIQAFAAKVREALDSE